MCNQLLRREADVDAAPRRADGAGGSPVADTAAASTGAGGSAAAGVGMSRSAATKETATETITSGIASRPLDSSSSVASSTEVMGSRSMAAVIAPMPMAAPAIKPRPGRCESAIPPTAPMNIAGKIGPPRNELNAKRVGEGLAQDEQHERSDRVAGGVAEHRAQRRLPREQHQRRALVGALGEGDRQAHDDQADDRREQHHPRLDVGADAEGEPADARAHDGGEHADRDRPRELGHGGRADRREVGYDERERAQPRPRVEAEEDQGPDSRGDEARDEHERHRRSGQPRGLHEQERAQQGRTQQGADGAEAAGRGDDGHRLRGRVAGREPYGADAEPAAQGDERGLGPDDDAEAEAGEGGEEDAGELDRRRWGLAGREPVGGRLAPASGEVPDRQTDQHAGQHQQRDGPPHRGTVEAEVLRKVGEQPVLQLVDHPQEAVGDGRDRGADDGREHQELQIAGRTHHRVCVDGIVMVDLSVSPRSSKCSAPRPAWTSPDPGDR